MLLELESATSKFTVRHNTSRPYVDQTKAVVEREIRTVLEGTRSNLCQAGLPDKLWPLAAQHHAMALNLTKSTENVTGASKFAGKGEDGIFLEYHIQPGFIWRHEYVVAPKLDDQECVFPPIRTRVCLERPCALDPSGIDLDEEIAKLRQRSSEPVKVPGEEKPPHDKGLPSGSSSPSGRWPRVIH